MNKAMREICRVALVIAILSSANVGRASNAHTNPLNSDPLVRDGYAHFYLMDYPAAVERFERFHEAHPGDPQATTLLLDAILFQELYRQDLLDTTFYANDGFLTGRHATDEDPQIRDRIMGLADEAIHEADLRLSENSNDRDALYARGWARSLKCTYVAMVQHGFGTGLRLANKAKDDHARLLQLDPEYVDAQLVVGVYEYVVGALPIPFKLLIGFAGITGSKSKGLERLEDDAKHGAATNVEARIVLALFLRREGRYREAVEVVRSLRRQYPRNYLFCIEEANLRKDAGEGMQAVDAYRSILAENAKAGYFPEARLELTYFGLGDALRGQRHYAESAEAYEEAATIKNAGSELKVRSLLAAGECRDLLGQRDKAVHDYQSAVDAGPRTSRADTARKRLKNPYHHD